MNLSDDVEEAYDSQSDLVEGESIETSTSNVAASTSALRGFQARTRTRTRTRARARMNDFRALTVEQEHQMRLRSQAGRAPAAILNNQLGRVDLNIQQRNVDLINFVNSNFHNATNHDDEGNEVGLGLQEVGDRDNSGLSDENRLLHREHISIATGNIISNFSQNGMNNYSINSTSCFGWSVVDVRNNVELTLSGPMEMIRQAELISAVPCQRSLHSAAVLNDCLYIFGGYSGTQRLNDFHCFSFTEKTWKQIFPSDPSEIWPSPRDRHISVAHGNSFYVFGGFNGTSRVNDFFSFNTNTMTWQQIDQNSGSPPSPRHSHAAVVHDNCLYVYGGYDGSYRCDFHCFNFLTNTWSIVPAAGRPPRARYRATCVVHKNTMICFAGHDGTQHLADTHVFDFDTRIWSRLITEGPPPIPRDSHVSVVVANSMWVFAGSTGSAMNDLHQLNLSCSPPKWSQSLRGGSPGHRFCHVAVVYEHSIYVFGGYNGSTRLNDFVSIDLSLEDLTCDVPPPTLIADMKSFINNETFSDITLIVEDRPINCHKIMLMRCPYFQAMLLGEMMESTQSIITLHEVQFSIFMILLEYLYTDEVEVPIDVAMEVLAAADQFCLSRLKVICENKLLESIHCENAALIFLEADAHDAVALKTKTLRYIVAHFETISKTSSFEEMARQNIELVFEILRNR